MVEKDFVYEFYIVQNNTLKQLAEHLGISKSSAKRLVDSYGIKKDKSNIYEDRKSPIKGKIAVNNGKYTIFISSEESIPSGFVVGSIAKRTHESYVDGGEKSAVTQKNSWANKTDEEKALWSRKMSESHSTSTFREFASKKAQAENASLTEEEKARRNSIRSRSLKRYWSSLPDEEKDLLKKKKIEAGAGWNHKKIAETNLEKYGVTNQFQRTDVDWNYSHSDSGPNLKFAEELVASGINFTREFPIGRYSFDFKINKVLVEIDPAITHNTTFSPFGDHTSHIEPDYHMLKSKAAEEAGYHCIHVFDWDDKEKVINLLKDRPTVYARKCKIENIDKKVEADFLNAHHLQGYSKSVVAFGLFYNDNLVSVMTFCKPRYNRNYQWELLRYCSSYNVIGGAEKLFSNFIKEYSPVSIVSYCDVSKFKGDVYSRLGFTLKKKNKPSIHWFNVKTGQHITDNFLRQRGFDQLFGTNYGKGTSNKELMLEAGFVEVYDAGQNTYIWTER